MIKRLSVLFVLIALPLWGFAQQPVDTLATREVGVDTVRKKIPFQLDGVRLGTDVARLIGMSMGSDGRSFELNSDFSFGRYIFSADWGTGRQNRFTDTLNYRTSGTYFRIGPDVNFIPENEDHNVFFLGARYGWSSFEEQLNTHFQHDDWGAFPFYSERRTSARWFEAVAGLKARVWNNFYLGYTMHIKFGLKVNDDSRFTAYEVPGFGKVSDSSNFSFAYHVFYRIPYKGR